MKDADYLAKARQHIQLAESLNPDSARVRIAAGLLNETTSRYESALEDYRRVQELEPLNVDAFLRVASIYDKLDRPEKAIEAYRKAIAIEQKEGNGVDSKFLLRIGTRASTLPSLPPRRARTRPIQERALGAITENEWRYNQLIKQFLSEAEPPFEDSEQLERWWGRNWGC